MHASCVCQLRMSIACHCVSLRVIACRRSEDVRRELGQVPSHSPRWPAVCRVVSSPLATAGQRRAVWRPPAGGARAGAGSHAAATRDTRQRARGIFHLLSLLSFTTIFHHYISLRLVAPAPAPFTFTVASSLCTCTLQAAQARCRMSCIIVIVIVIIIITVAS